MKRLVILFITIVCVLFSGCSAGNGKSTVRVAVIDTGFSTKAIPKENIVEGNNYLDKSLSTDDTYGHGTAMASIILEECNGVELVPLISNAYEDGKITQVDNDVFAQIIIDAVKVYKCDIINISAGLMLDKPSVKEAILFAEENNVLIVASGGNDYVENGQSKYYPAAYESVLAVGSVNKEETDISSFSQRGDWIDIYTCGEDVTYATLSGSTRMSDGTSYSTARISGYAANILKNSKTKLEVSKLREIIKNNANVLHDGTKYITQK